MGYTTLPDADEIERIFRRATAPLVEQVRALRAELARSAKAGPPSEYVTVGAAAKYLGCSPTTVDNWRKSGRLGATKGPGGWTYRRADLDAAKAGVPSETT